MQVDLGMWTTKICSALGFTSLILNSMTNSCTYYPVLPLVNGVMSHAMLPEVGVLLLKAVPSPPMLMLSQMDHESHKATPAQLGDDHPGQEPRLSHQDAALCLVLQKVKMLCL